MMLGGPIWQVHAVDLPSLEEDSELARVAILHLANGGYGILQATGSKSGLIVEAEAIGEAGRISAREDAGTICYERFEPSRHYDGYRELIEVNRECHETLVSFSPFIEIANELAALATDAIRRPTCSGDDALAVVRILDAMDRCESGGTSIEPLQSGMNDG